ncbi:MAG TPA: hypothetical protein VGN83_12050 [Falsiroseomonas sp.]|nr:hypothetical protein [Falsiroseomonas sp.]
MARRCSVCARPEAHQINLALLGGASIRDVAGRFGLSRTSTGNHALHHLRQRVAEGAQMLTCSATGDDAPSPDAMELAREVKRQEEIRLAENASLREHLARDLARLDRIYAVALSAGRLGDATKAINAAWAIKSRVGLLADLDAVPTAPPQTDRSVAGVMGLHDVMRGFMADVARITGRVPFRLDLEEVDAEEVQP